MMVITSLRGESGDLLASLNEELSTNNSDIHVDVEPGDKYALFRVLKLTRIEGVEKMDHCMEYIEAYVRLQIIPNQEICEHSGYVIKRSLELMMSSNSPAAKEFYGWFENSPIYRRENDPTWGLLATHKGIRGLLAEAIVKSGNEDDIKKLDALLLDEKHDLHSKLAIIYGKASSKTPEKDLELLRKLDVGEFKPELEKSIKALESKIADE